ncbi:TonB-dependent receptor [candidate division KSB1 bacterium]|nr:TonB-dependent receptor [candidate division KSB1 bacterium]
MLFPDLQSRVVRPLASLFFSLMLLLPVVGFAQGTGTVVGLVTDDATGEPLPGANLVVKGTNLGGATGIDGTYLVKNVPPGSYTLVASFIGYKDAEAGVVVRSGEQATVDFQLKVSALQMDEVVVTGTGSEIKKKELTTPITTISTKEIEAAPVENVFQLLNGRVAGAKVNVNTGLPGTGARLRTRGVTSANVSQTPVIYVDGVRVDTDDNFRLGNLVTATGGPASSALSDIFVDEIERVEVTKGGAASTLFGSEAASGVIQIFTKKGRAGPVRWRFKSEQGFDAPDEQFIITDFLRDHVLRTGYFQSYIVGVEGGSEFMTYNVNFRLKDEENPMPTVGNTTYTGRVGLRAFLSEKTQVDVSLSATRDQFGRVVSDNGGPASIVTSVESNSRPVKFDEETLQDPEAFEAALAYRDAVFSADFDEFVNRYTFGTTVNYRPLSIFNNRLTLGVDFRKNENRQFVPFGSDPVVWGTNADGAIFRSDRENLILTLNYAGSISYPSEGAVTSTFTFGAQGFREEDRESAVSATSLGLPGNEDFDNAANITAFESNRQLFNGGIFFNEQLGLWDRLFLNLGVRFDGNSAFGDEVGLQTYPKAGIAYTISEQGFWKNSFLPSFWDDLKFRASFGRTGKFPDPFVKDRTFAQGSFLQQVSVNFNNAGDPDLGPETTETFDFGFDAAFLDNRLGLEFTYFSETTEDALFTVPNQPNSGFPAQLRNVGEIENKGIELALNATLISSRKVHWTFGLTYTTLDNEVTSIGGAQPFSIGGFAFLPQRVEEGHPVGVFRTNVPQEDGTFETILEKSPLPTKSGSIFTTLQLFRKFSLSLLGDWQTGGYILNTGGVLRFFAGEEPHASLVPEGFSFTTASDVFMEDSDFFKLREISARYELGNLGFRRIQNLVLTASVRNVFTIDNTRFSDLDPELNGVRAVGGTGIDVGGINFFTLSPPRQFRFGVEVGL